MIIMIFRGVFVYFINPVEVTISCRIPKFYKLANRSKVPTPLHSYVHILIRIKRNSNLFSELCDFFGKKINFPKGSGLEFLIFPDMKTRFQAQQAPFEFFRRYEIENSLKKFLDALKFFCSF